MNTENDSFFVDMTLGQGTQSNYLFAPRTPHPAPRTPHPAPRTPCLALNHSKRV
jgi:hypothetical protein